MTKDQEDILAIVSEFPQFCLDELDKLNFMNRFDEKYYFHKSKLKEVLNLLKDDVRVLTIDDNRMFSYETQYLDTENMDLYMKHHNKRRKRYKLRFRKYLETGLHFLEVKLKEKNGEMIKSRMKLSELEDDNTLDSMMASYLENETPYKLSELSISLLVNYQRITLMTKTGDEVMTIDQNLSFKAPATNTVRLNNLVILELKKKEHNINSIFRKCLRQLGIRSKPISKYCLGVSHLYKHLKSNAFKDQWRQVNKIENYA